MYTFTFLFKDSNPCSKSNGKKELTIISVGLILNIYVDIAYGHSIKSKNGKLHTFRIVGIDTTYIYHAKINKLKNKLYATGD